MNLHRYQLASNSRVLRERGLTLVEIVIVLIILGLIMTFIGSRLIGAGDKAKADLTRLKIKDLGSSIEQFQLRYNGLPNSLNDLIQCSERTGPDCIPVSSADSLKDAWGNQFNYALENNGRSYKITSLGADGKEGGTAVDYDVFGTGP